MLDLNQDTSLDALDWEEALMEFIKQYSIGFIKMELLMLFYRYQLNVVTTAEIIKRTGYHLQEVNVNLVKLVADRLLGSLAPGPATAAVYRRLEKEDFTGRGLILQILERMAVKFNEREGRLKIIYTILKVQD